MKRKVFLSAILAVSAVGTALADIGQTVTVDGSARSGFVSRISFSGDNVTLTYADGTTEVADMSKVDINLTYDGTGIINAKSDDNAQKDNRIYTLSGQTAGRSTQKLHRGVYIINGKKTIIK